MSKAHMYALGRLKAGKMNNTEKLYKARLEAMRLAGEVLWYEFEPANLRLGDKCFYKVDFMVMLSTGELQVHEIKGYWTDDALVKIKVAAEKFPFKFVAMQYKKKQWEQREF